jgi:hypothetical protein
MRRLQTTEGRRRPAPLDILVGEVVLYFHIVRKTNTVLCASLCQEHCGDGIVP